ncbi:MAG: hypothetical protein ACK4ZR_06900 [Aquificaceae bacterium]
MNILPPYMSIYNQILQDLEKAMPFLKVPKAKAGRKPKLTDTQIAAMFILSYITGMKVLKEDRIYSRWDYSGCSQCKQGKDTEDKEAMGCSMVGKKAQEDKEKGQWAGSRV